MKLLQFFSLNYSNRINLVIIIYDIICHFSAAQAAGTIFILSTLSTSSIEEVAKAAPDCIKWFQLYTYNDRNVTIDLIRRAERAGFKALVLTIDTPLFGDRRNDMRNKFALPSHLRYLFICFIQIRWKINH